MGRPLGPGGRAWFLRVMWFLKKRNRNTGRIKYRIRRSGDTIVANDQTVMRKKKPLY